MRLRKGCGHQWGRGREREHHSESMALLAKEWWSRTTTLEKEGDYPRLRADSKCPVREGEEGKGKTQ